VDCDDKPEDVADLLRQRAMACRLRYERARKLTGSGAVSEDEADQRLIEWYDARLELARELRNA
jgi:hypothetical protein